jgi:aminoacrylate hydrolase
MPLADLGDVSLHYRSYGQGEPVLGIMGLGLDQRYWAGQVPAITPGNRFITFDNRGSGRSSAIITSSIDELANDAVRLLDHLDIEETVIFGASMGGAIAQRVALDHPERVSGLILAVTWARPLEFMRRSEQIARDIVKNQGTEAFVDVTLIRMFTPRFFEMGRDAIEMLVSSMNAPGAPALISAEALEGQFAAIEKHDTLAELPKITCPTLVVGGRLDMMVPAFASEEIAAAIPGAELVMFDTGHALMIEEMDLFNQTVRRFLDSLQDAG